MKKVVYIGSNPKVAEFIMHSKQLELDCVICEKRHMTDEMLTFSLVRQIDLVEIGNKNELIESIKKYDESYIFIMYIFGMKIPMEFLNGYKI